MKVDAMESIQRVFVNCVGYRGRAAVSVFASSYTREVSLAGALTVEAMSVYGKQATGQKYLINPNKGLS